MNSREILSMNLKYYQKKYHLSQEKLAEKLESNLVYINQLERCRRKATIDMLDKIAQMINQNIDSNLNIKASDLIKYNPRHKTSFTRIDERIKN